MTRHIDLVGPVLPDEIHEELDPEQKCRDQHAENCGRRDHGTLPALYFFHMIPAMPVPSIAKVVGSGTGVPVISA
jgi:hypothetical protein